MKVAFLLALLSGFSPMAMAEPRPAPQARALEKYFEGQIGVTREEKDGVVNYEIRIYDPEYLEPFEEGEGVGLELRLADEKEPDLGRIPLFCGTSEWRTGTGAGPTRDKRHLSIRFSIHRSMDRHTVLLLTRQYAMNAFITPLLLPAGNVVLDEVPATTKDGTENQGE